MQIHEKKITLNFLAPAMAALTVLSMGIVPAQGQGKNEEVTIIAPYIPSIGEASKFPFRPEITPEESAPQSFQYNYVEKTAEAKLELDPVDPVRVSEGKQEDLHRNFAKVGFGNYLTPYVRFMASNLQSEKYQFGADLLHHSSQGGVRDYENEAFSHNKVSVFGRIFLENHTLTGDMGYDRDVYHFYGFPADSFPGLDIDKEDLKQRFQHFKIGLEFQSNYTEHDAFHHKFGIEFHQFSDRYETRESHFRFRSNGNKNLSGKGSDYQHSANLDLNLDYLAHSDTLWKKNVMNIELVPVYRFGFAQYRFEAGLNINFSTENVDTTSNFTINVFPHLKAEVIILEDKLKAYAEVTGGRTINSSRSLTTINPFITTTPVLAFTDRQVKIGGGITGNAGGLNFQAEASYSYLNNLPLFVTDTSLALENQFLVLYDDANLLNVKASLGYIRLSNLSARLTANYFHYMPKNEEKAWQMPNFEVGLEAGYRFKEKYLLKTSFLALGTRYARDFDNGTPIAIKMKGAFDLSLGFEYRINRMIAVYLDAHNILNQNYQQWYHYPVQGILVIAGVKISF